ncbi:acyl-CoA thioesterase [Hoeflea prorocentri]|uniref:Thioesterase family protein n=1 Tax=Hoeflea prorocentri TaxID=1922333 RepID=A0A9X3UGA6_9HYPH|nr:thioesterase family protein [Hoeflea prorocentri]MCY6379985.1 thioesterase family protein [Hoeflea prorocentri]MDA5397785.1 thioesterase family protein [Hoeflea prorocentri]
MTFTLDDSLGLEAPGNDTFRSQTDQRYWNMKGPYGGWIAALLIKAVLHDLEDARFEPIALTVDFMKAPPEGPLILRRTCDRVGRTAAFWRVMLELPDGTPCARAMLTLAPHRETLIFSNPEMPDVPPAEAVETFNGRMLPINWAKLYETRPIKGKMGDVTSDAHSLVWTRDADGRPLDYLSITAIADSPFPRLFLATGRPSNISTISMTVYFHSTTSEMAAIGNDSILVDARCERSFGGFYDQHTRFYARSGETIAVSQQMVWYDRAP